MQAYTVSFIFDPTLERVLLIHKNRPAWQRGKLNGVGGKLEAGETPVMCITREVREETGLVIAPSAWIAVGAMTSEEWHVSVFTSIYHGTAGDARSVTNEQIEWITTARLPHTVVPNLAWLIPLCQVRLREARDFHIDIYYH